MLNKTRREDSVSVGNGLGKVGKRQQVAVCKDMRIQLKDIYSLGSRREDGQRNGVKVKS